MTPKVYAGAKLRDVRQRVMLSQRDFAQRLGVSIPYLSQMENNNRFITCDILTPTKLPYK